MINKLVNAHHSQNGQTPLHISLSLRKNRVYESEIIESGGLDYFDIKEANEKKGGRK